MSFYESELERIDWSTKEDLPQEAKSLATQVNYCSFFVVVKWGCQMIVSMHLIGILFDGETEELYWHAIFLFIGTAAKGFWYFKLSSCFEDFEKTR